MKHKSQSRMVRQMYAESKRQPDPHLVQFFVPGIPRPGGSKRAFTVKRKDGSVSVRVADMGGELTMQWRSIVSDFGLRAMAGKKPFTQALSLEVLFRMPRPKAHLNKYGALIPKYENELFTKRPDTTKLLRAVEDSLSGIVWEDDAQVVKQVAYKFYHALPGAFITVGEASRLDIVTKRDQVYHNISESELMGRLNVLRSPVSG